MKYCHVTHTDSIADTYMVAGLIQFQLLVKTFQRLLKMHHASWSNASTVTTDVAVPSLLKLNLQPIIHKEHRVDVNNLRFGVKVKSNTVSLIKWPYFIKLARTETLGCIIRTLLISTILSFVLKGSLNWHSVCTPLITACEIFFLFDRMSHHPLWVEGKRYSIVMFLMQSYFLCTNIVNFPWVILHNSINKNTRIHTYIHICEYRI